MNWKNLEEMHTHLDAYDLPKLNKQKSVIYTDL